MKLGDIAKDTITGFEGVIVAWTTWINGCERLTLQPKKMRDGKPIDSMTFDIEQMALVKSIAPPPITPTGGPHPEPMRQKAVK
jgi:hypothetical protein